MAGVYRRRPWRIKAGRARASAWVGSRLGIPVNTAPPSFTGTLLVGSTLTGALGSYTNSPTSFARQWYRDNAGGGVYSAIGGATASTYVLVDADDRCNIKYGVTPSNSGGTGVETRSSASGPITEPAPVNTVLPAVTGLSVRVGVVQTCDDGTWLHMGGLGATFTRQWRRSADGSTGWANISGATSPTYTPIVGDIGFYLDCVVTAHNSGSP